MQRLRQSGTPPAGLLCLVVLLSAGMLAGCAVSTGRVTADAALPVHYPGVTADENASAASLPWQEVFRDPHLQALIRQALEEILPEARVLAAADVIESMAAHRPYRAALGLDVAMAEIDKNRGQLYDPEVADAMGRLVRQKNYQLPD